MRKLILKWRVDYLRAAAERTLQHGDPLDRPWAERLAEARHIHERADAMLLRSQQTTKRKEK